MTSSEYSGSPQIVSPAFFDLVDVVGWKTIDDKWINHMKRTHNLLGEAAGTSH